jgi:hypothetical protein
MTTRILVAAAVAAMFLPSTLARADNPRLVATVGRNDSFTISLRDASGNPVTHLDAGTYDIEVHDLSETHNFRLHALGSSRRQTSAARRTSSGQSPSRMGSTDSSARPTRVS